MNKEILQELQEIKKELQDIHSILEQKNKVLEFTLESTNDDDVLRYSGTGEPVGIISGRSLNSLD